MLAQLGGALDSLALPGNLASGVLAVWWKTRRTRREHVSRGEPHPFACYRCAERASHGALSHFLAEVTAPIRAEYKKGGRTWRSTLSSPSWFRNNRLLF